MATTIAPLTRTLDHLPPEVQEMVRAVARAVVEAAPVEMLILFGSFARGTFQAVLEGRGIEVSEEVRGRILGCREEAVLVEWLRRAGVVHRGEGVGGGVKGAYPRLVTLATPE